MPKHHVLLVPGFFGFGSLGEITYFAGIRPLLVRATTRDGLRVLVAAEATVVLPRLEAGVRFVDPWPAAEPAAEEAIVRAIAGWTTTDLLSGVSGYHGSLRHAVSAAADPHGVAVHELLLDAVDVLVDVGDVGGVGGVGALAPEPSRAEDRGSR